MATNNKRFFTDIIGMEVVSASGDHIGKLSNLVIDSDRGQVLSLLVEPEKEFSSTSFVKDKEGFYNIPVNLVSSIEDYVVIKTKE
ncbi:MAG: PRC-barrel domain-containing protein [Candidatus Thermoplasmatota archaeon]|nr:PRC-barrel domain-containing protein [Candidatus Thermoplasmatota archaeon]MCL5800255.1 PRC-barrel domain-containing protein [Candidatus Thermoplasmatota archaeon]